MRPQDIHRRRPPEGAAAALVGLLLLGHAAGVARAADPDAPMSTTTQPDGVEEMLVVGDPRPTMDVLAGATTTRIETDARLVEIMRIDDLLAEVPGVQIRRFGGVGERFEISIRGSRPEQVPVFLDGFRLDTSLTGSSDLSTLCLDVLDEVQVTRGTGAARAGTGAIGGVVNLVSRRAPEKPETRLRIAGGSFGTVEGSVRHARRAGDWDLSLSICGFHTEGDFRFQQARFITDGTPTGSASVVDRVNNEADRQTGLAQIGRRLGQGSLRLTQLTSHLERGVPGSDRDQRTESNEKNLSTLTALAFEYPVAGLPEGKLEAATSHRWERDEYKDPGSFQLLALDPIDSTTDIHNAMARLGLETAIEALAGHHALSLLAEGRVDQRGSNEARSESRAGIAVRLELESRWWQDRLSVSPSLRLERYEGLDLEWIPGLHLRLEPVDWIELRAGVARSYRIPSFQELYLPDRGFQRGNPNLRPEDAWSVEAGVTLTSPFEPSWLDGEVELTGFAGQVDNAIAYELISTNVSSYRNTGSSDTLGYELSLRWRPHPWVRISGSRTVTQAELDSTGSQVAGVAVSQTDGRIELGPRDRLRLVAEVHYTGRIPASQGGRAEIPSNTSYDASASIDLTKFPILRMQRFGRSLWLSVRGRNLGNAALRDSQYFPRPGRNFAIALESVF